MIILARVLLYNNNNNNTDVHRIKKKKKTLSISNLNGIKLVSTPTQNIFLQIHLYSHTTQNERQTFLWKTAPIFRSLISDGGGKAETEKPRSIKVTMGLFISPSAGRIKIGWEKKSILGIPSPRAEMQTAWEHRWSRDDVVLMCLQGL